MPTLVDPDPQADERTTLTQFLDYQRAVAVRKLGGLTTEQAVSVATPSGLTALGVVKHLVFVEDRWFRQHLLGEGREGDHAASFVPTAEDTVESVVDAYEAACARSREITAGVASLDQVVALTHPALGTMSLRWILAHMIEEVARHNGHLDVLREQIDGATGD